MNKLRRVQVAIFTVAIGATTAGCASDNSASPAARPCKPALVVTTVTKGTLTVAAVSAGQTSSVDAKGNYTGIESVLVKKFAKANCLELKVDGVNFAGAIPAVQSGRADMATGGFYRTAKRAEIVDLSDPMYVDNMAAVSKDGLSRLDDMKRLRIGTVDGYLWTPDVKATFGDKVTVYPSGVELRADLKAGRLDVAMFSFGGAHFQFKEDKDLTIKVVEQDSRVKATSEPAQVGFPMTKGNTSLATALNTAIKQWQRDGTIVAALTEYGLQASAAEVDEPRLVQ